MTWQEANKWEAEWHGNCVNSYNEETKQYIYAKYLGLHPYATNYYGQRGWDFGSRSVLDIGCGPYSILLKSKALRRVGIDPCPYPDWVKMRYSDSGIEFMNIKAEEMSFGQRFDEGIMYNVLQHTEDPGEIVKRALNSCKIIRVFEWIDEPLSPGHIHVLTEEKLNKWLGGEGRVVDLRENPCIGRAYYGIFKGNSYLLN